MHSHEIFHRPPKLCISLRASALRRSEKRPRPERSPAILAVSRSSIPGGGRQRRRAETGAEHYKYGNYRNVYTDPKVLGDIGRRERSGPFCPVRSVHPRGRHVAADFWRRPPPPLAGGVPGTIFREPFARGKGLPRRQAETRRGGVKSKRHLKKRPPAPEASARRAGAPKDPARQSRNQKE